MTCSRRAGLAVIFVGVTVLGGPIGPWLWPSTGLAAGSLPNLRAVSVVGPLEAVSGDEIEVVVEVEGDPVAVSEGGPFRVASYLAPSGVLEGALELGLSPPLSLGGQSALSHRGRFRVPVGYAGYGRLLAVIDPTGAMTESNELDNVVAARADTRVRAGGIDLSAQDVSVAPTSLEIDAPIAIAFESVNSGEIARVARFAAYMSRDALVTPSDTLLGAIDVDVPSRGRTSAIIETTLPRSVVVGDYTVGVIADPSGQIDELSELNNVATATSVLNVFDSELVVPDRPLPPGTFGVEYYARLQVVGGDGRYEFSVVDGSLPPGLVLEATSGVIEGTPTRAGVFDLSIAVSSRGAVARRAYSFEVRATEVPLAIVAHPLAEASIGFAYEQGLVAAGGEPPYHWSLAEDAVVPPGLDLTTVGTISGVPAAIGRYSFSVRVVDERGDHAETVLSVDVASRTDLLIRVEASSPTVSVGQTVDVPLFAVGGRSPYHWRALSTPPRGLTLTEDGRLRGVPASVGVWPFRVRVRDSGNVSLADTAILTVDVADDGGFRIVTTALPAGIVRRAYEAVLTTEGGQPPITWSLAPGDVLPEGFELVPQDADRSSGDGRSHDDGTQGSDVDSPDVVVLRGMSYVALTHAFELRATDAFGRRREVALALHFERVSRQVDDGGCACFRQRPDLRGAMMTVILGVGLFLRRAASARWSAGRLRRGGHRRQGTLFEA